MFASDSNVWVAIAIVIHGMFCYRKTFVILGEE
jgi:hypothetical protein